MQGIRFLSLFVFWALLMWGANLQAGETPSTKEDEQILLEANVPIDGPGLLLYFQKHTLDEMELLKARALIQQLGANSFRVREQASLRLIQLGAPVVKMLQEAAKSPDLEVSTRAAQCLKEIEDNAFPTKVALAAARLLRERKPEGTNKVLLNYLPYSNQETITEEVQTTLAHLAVKNDRPDPVLVAGLSDRSPIIRAASAEALLKAGAKEHFPAIHKLLDDDVATVRLRVGRALAFHKDKKGIPVIIASLPELSQSEAWQAEDVLLRLATNNNPPSLSVGQSKPERIKARDAWEAWWKKYQNKVDLARLQKADDPLGYTVVVLLDEGKIRELGPNNQVRWQINNLGFPLDLQMLPGDRILVAEYHSGRVTERNLKGEILWQHFAQNPLMAQRLPNGHTFIGSDSELVEIDRQSKVVFRFSFPDDERIMKSAKLPNGDIVCLTDQTRVVRLNSKGKELKSFHVFLGKRLFGGRIHMLPSGNVLVPHNAENKVVEYDIQGRVVWQVGIEEPIAATRLANGNTLVTSMAIGNYRAVEFDPKGQVVWQYSNNTRVTRAIRR